MQDVYTLLFDALRSIYNLLSGTENKSCTIFFIVIYVYDYIKNKKMMFISASSAK